MTTLYDLGMEIAKIREALGEIDVRGERNCSMMTYAFSRCNAIIEAINGIAEQAQNGQNGEKGPGEEGVTDGEQD